MTPCTQKAANPLGFWESCAAVDPNEALLYRRRGSSWADSTLRFPACRALVHHGGAGTTAASLRAGVPTLILWTFPDQSIWGTQVKQLKVGTSRNFSTTTRESLVSDLRRILAPEYVTRAREIATRMTKPSESITKAADLLENFARLRRPR